MTEVPLSATIPFLSLLAAIAVLPLIAERFWSRNRNKLVVVLATGIPAVIYLLTAGLGKDLYRTMVFDYAPFIILLGALFVVTGGVFVDSNIRATPVVNTVFLAIGSILASLLGTTGAAMLLIRPLFHINRFRSVTQHTTLFFIATVCNCGGLLTPLGDPPLFMMYLRGAPFGWFIQLAPEWLLANTAILFVYYWVDRFHWRKENPQSRSPDQDRPFSIEFKGRLNFLWLGGIILAIAFLNKNVIPAFRDNPYLEFAREAVILLMAAFSLIFTPHPTRVSNSFSWRPIQEVACLFLGIFAAMTPCLIYLEQNARSLGISGPTAFYYAAGAISSFLDNTPTAVTFHSLALGLRQSAPVLVAGIPEDLMRAVCTGSVFFGAMTYIGNGPNFMVKTMAEHQGIKMPSFFGYMWRFSIVVLLPVFILVQVLFSSLTQQ